MNYIAHTSKHGHPQLLKDHLAEVGRIARERMVMKSWTHFAECAGLLHDLGKYSMRFQNYLTKDNNADQDGDAETTGKGPDHSSAGAQFLLNKLRDKTGKNNDPELRRLVELVGRLVSHCIAGHHSGLLDGFRSELGASLDRRLTKELEDYERNVEPEVRDRIEILADVLLTEGNLDAVCKWISKQGTISGRESFALQFAIRMLFSVLVDADRLDSEHATEPKKARVRESVRKDGFDRLLKTLEKHLTTLPREGKVNKLRKKISDRCANSGKLRPGFFSLTVPTGGGKTLASLRFALRHIIAHKMKRIIYVMPYTTIIEQNAEVFRLVLANDSRSGNVLEHHASLAEDKETKENRLLAENWDAPIVVTTSVQFFESLYASKASRCRRLHSIASSVVILDEAQTVPVRYLKAVTWSLEELVKNWGCTVVFCTATQPVLDSSKLDDRSEDDLRVGISGIHEIIQHPEHLCRDLRRVEVTHLATDCALSPEQVADRVMKKATEGHSVLSVVNTKKNVRAIYDSLRGNKKLKGRLFHLSTAMCPQHRLDTIVTIRNLLGRFREGEPVAPVVVSTQLIEAGVDLDFDAVFRAMAGVDSIAQAAGRCNRENKMKQLGEVFVYEADENLGSLVDIIEAKRLGLATLAVLEVSGNITGDERNPIGIKAVEEYFQRLYWSRRQAMDSKDIVARLVACRPIEHAADIPFATVAADFRFIEQDTIPVVVPYGVAGLALVERLKEMEYCPSIGDIRMAQRYSVQLWQNALARYNGFITELACGIRILESPRHYNIRLGLLGPDALSVEDYIL